tara:strand:- start:644 stop:865 length:222 start_codon:yes stop_codon:yes gene_type:complete
MKLLKWIRKERIVIIDSNWNILFDYDSNIKPGIGEFIYNKHNDLYYRVVNVVHSVEKYDCTVHIIVENISALR